MNWARCAGPTRALQGRRARSRSCDSYSDPARVAACRVPGHQSVFRPQAGTFISFHGWATRRSCSKAADARYLYIAPFGWENDAPAIASSLRPTAAR
jgi:hypothetical protein